MPTLLESLAGACPGGPNGMKGIPAGYCNQFSGDQAAPSSTTCTWRLSLLLLGSVPAAEKCSRAPCITTASPLNVSRQEKSCSGDNIVLLLLLLLLPLLMLLLLLLLLHG